MGVRITVGGIDYEVEDYSVSEDATPLAAGDSSGAVGSFDFSLPFPDEDAGGADHPITLYGSAWLIGQDVSILSDTNYGFTLGQVDEVSDNPATINVSCLSRLGELSVYGIQANPFIGTLAQAFEYYLSLAGIDTDFVIDSAIASRPVVFPGFYGELWFNLKQMAAAQDCDISLVSGVVVLRPIRVRVAEKGRTLQRSGNAGQGSLAQSVEVYWYDSREITDELAYPVGGWTPETEVLNVNAGETTEYTLELSASLSSIEAPTMETFVSSSYDSSSVYTVVADDGLPVSEAQWLAAGGKVEVELNPDTTSLTVRLTGATGVPIVTGGNSQSFSLALASDTSGSRYSTLRIVGTGVSYVKNKKRIRTGVPATQTSTEVGVTIDNPFITSINSLYSAGTRAAKNFAGLGMSLTGEVTTVNPRGDSGVIEALSYDAVEDILILEIGGTPTYDDVETYYSGEGYDTYMSIQDFWFAQTSDDFANQTFGNVQGARIWDSKRKRWFRIRSATVTPGGIRINSADDDLTNEDVQGFFEDMASTYADVQAYREGLTYKQEGMVGLRVS